MPPAPIVEGVWRIETPLPFRPRSVHAYLAEAGSGGWMLVDGGANTDAAWAALDRGVRDAVGGWSAVRLHLVTHMHLDHLGLAERVREASGAPLAMHVLDAERTAHAAAHPEEEAEYWVALLRECGAPEDLVVQLQRGRAEADPLSSFVPADHVLEGDRGRLPAAPGWQFVWTPGHTAGHLALFRERDGLLIAGDAVLPRITPTIGVNRQREDPVGDYLDALARIQALPVRTVLPGHGEAIAPALPRVAELRAATREESDHVAALLTAEPATVAEIATVRYARRALPPAQTMQALRETLAHLLHLARRGRARSGRDGDAEVVRFWHP